MENETPNAGNSLPQSEKQIEVGQIYTPEEMTKAIKDLTAAVDMLCYYVPINQNILVGLMRHMNVSPKKASEFIAQPKDNEEYEKKITDWVTKRTGTESMSDFNESVADDSETIQSINALEIDKLSE